MKKNWKIWNIGDTIKWSWDDFDGKGSVIGILTKQEEDHAIVEADDMHLWIDDDTSDMFERIM